MKSLLLIIFFSCLFIFGCDKSIENYEAISSEEAYKIFQNNNIQLVDVRTPKEYKEGFIENAQNIDFFSEDFSDNINMLDKQKPLVLYCRSGNRSRKSYKKISGLGFVKVYDIKGGIIKWKADNFDVILK